MSVREGKPFANVKRFRGKSGESRMKCTSFLQFYILNDHKNNRYVTELSKNCARNPVIFTIPDGINIQSIFQVSAIKSLRQTERLPQTVRFPVRFFHRNYSENYIENHIPNGPNRFKIISEKALHSKIVLRWLYVTISLAIRGHKRITPGKLFRFSFR